MPPMTQNEGTANGPARTRDDSGRRTAAAPEADASAARQRLLASGAFLLLQVALTDYGAEAGLGAVFWFAIGAVLLRLVYTRHSRLARGIVVVLALMGAVLYGLAALDSGRAAVLSIAYLGQALPLLTDPVRRHVHARP
jgi:Mn2+/Fe2+ NRAMP family transporter